MSAIRAATDQDIPKVARLFGRAFVDDAMLRWPFPAGATADDIAVLFSILLDAYHPLGVVTVTDDVAGAAVWMPPAEAARFLEIEAPTRELIRPLTDDDGARYDTFWDWLGGHLPDDPCWFLDILAVDASARGRGHGTRLIEHGLARAHAERLPAFLETSRPDNVALYERFGFQVVEELIAPAGGPAIWFLRADPPRA
ncbi:MAG: GNAT family N-acetyltransferase [Actinomycetota bacterium]